MRAFLSQRAAERQKSFGSFSSEKEQTSFTDSSLFQEYRIRIHVSHSPGEVRIALTGADDTLLDFAVWRPGAPDGLGDVYTARVQSYAPALAGYFVALPAEVGFLPESAGHFADGTLIAVRVARAAQGGKGKRLALAAEAVGAGGAPGLVSRGETPLERLAGAHPQAEIVADSRALLPGLRRAFGERARFQADAFEGVCDAVEALGEDWAALPGGMRAGFFPTPALTAIDLDGGSASASRAPKPQAQFAANLAAMPALARQIRLRNLSGVILVDPAGVAARRRKALGPVLAEALAADPVGPRLLGFTQAGLAEIIRQRLAPPLHALLQSPLGRGLTALREAGRLVRPAGALAAGRLVLRAEASVLAAIRGDSHALPECETLYGVRPDLQEGGANTTPVCSVE